MDQIERLIQHISDSLLKKSTSGGTQKLTILNNRVVGTAQACRSCMIHAPTENSGKIYLTTANENADTNDFRIPLGQVIPWPVDDLSDLRFYGTVNGDVIHVAWRN